MSWDLDAMSVLPEEKQSDVMENFSPQYLAEVLSEYITEIQEQKPVVDEHKKKMAEELIRYHFETSGNICECVYCMKYAEGDCPQKIEHRKDCIVTASQEYLKSLEGE